MDQYFDKVQNYLLDLDYNITHTDHAASLFVVNNEQAGIYNLIIDCEDPILILELFLFDLKQADATLLLQLLEMNREVVHGAFALDATNGKVIFRDTLQLENLDLNELQASLNAIELMLCEYSDTLIKMAKNQQLNN